MGGVDSGVLRTGVEPWWWWSVVGEGGGGRGLPRDGCGTGCACQAATSRPRRRRRGTARLTRPTWPLGPGDGIAGRLRGVWPFGRWVLGMAGRRHDWDSGWLETLAFLPSEIWSVFHASQALFSSKK